MNKNIYILQILLLIFLGKNLFADNYFIPRQKKFIFKLYKDKRYFDAITETGRLIQYNKKNSFDYSYFINLNYFAGGQYKTVLMNLFKNPDPDFADQLLAAQTYFKLGDPNSALKTLSQIDKSKLSQEEEHELIFRQIELELFMQNHREPQTLCTQYLVKFPKAPSILSLKNEIQKHPAPDQKSVPLAVTLSILLPGSGQFYSGKYWQAIITLLAVSAASYASYYLYKNDERALSYTSGFFAVLFYSGNIYGAYNSAASYNKREWNTYYKNMTSNYITPYQPEKYLRKDIF